MSDAAAQQVATVEDRNRHLPSGWQWAKIASICEVVTGTTPSKDEARYYNGAIPWIKPDDLDRTQYVDSSAEYLSEEGAKCARLLPTGSVLVSCIGKLGKCVIAARPLATNQQINALIPQAGVDSVFLYYLVKQLKRQLENASSTNLLPIINKSILSAIEIPIPPHPEQLRLAALLDQELTVVERARAAAEAQLETANGLCAAYIRRAFGSEEALQWPKATIGQLAVLVQNGIYKSAEYYGSGHPFVRMYNIPNNSWELDLTRLAQVVLEDRELEAFRLQSGDLLFSRVNSFELVGKCAVVSGDAEGHVFENMMLRVRLNDSANPLFVAQQMQTKEVREQIQRVAKRAIGQASINGDDLRGIEIFLPDIRTQDCIATFLTKATKKAETALDLIRERLDGINALPAALLRRAFNGELA